MFQLKQARACRDGTSLVPFDKEFVPAYNACIAEDTQLREMIATEPVTLEQEYVHRREWMTDPTRLCLLVMDDAHGFAGDVNVFLREEESEEDGAAKLRIAELSVMICPEAMRKRGHASRALTLLFELLREHDIADVLEAHVLMKNAASIALFRKLGFEVQSRNEAFDELVMTRLLVV
jgi:RimJ/RimL family protein N-acetyltransferase